MTTPIDRVGLPAKPAGPGHNSPGMICHHWAVHRLTCADYEDLRAFAGGKCGICNTPEAKTRRGFLVVDHFHGKNGASFIRGMLCDWCNQSVMLCIDGLKAWNPVNRQFEAAAREYERHSWEQPSDEAVRQLAAREEMPRKTSPRRVAQDSGARASVSIPSTAERLTAAWTTLRAHGITLDGCDLPAESILAIAAIASGEDSRVKAA